MPRSVSSSSEDEATNNSTAQSLPDQEGNETSTSRYKCPADFVSFCYKPCSGTLMDSLKKEHTELWLIKAPASFNPECFNGVDVSLSGLQTLQIPSPVGGAKSGSGSGQQIYNVLASDHGCSELNMLTGSGSGPSSKVVCGPTFAGQLNICESYGDSSTNLAPQIIPAAPAPFIPPGLKQRFQPFGSKTPTFVCVGKSEVDGSAYEPSCTTHLPIVGKRYPEEEEERQRRKKKKRVKGEGEEVQVKEEPGVSIPDLDQSMEVPSQDNDVITEKRKKKKKKNKEKEAEEVHVKEEVMDVKTEPVDPAYGDCETLKKKKKKKKVKQHDD